MRALKIFTYGHPVLRKKAKPVERIDAAIRQLAERMVDTMHKAEGIGLAAPQIGKSIALFVVDVAPFEDGAKPMVFLNMEILEGRGECAYKEGCLSIPDVSAEVLRPESVRIRYTDLEGRRLEGVAEGIMARVIQHETDHLNGKLFIDYLDPETLSSFQAILKKLEQKNKRLLARKKATA